MSDVILRRQCQIEPIGGGEPTPLLVEFLRPSPTDPETDTVSESFKISCKHFNETISLRSGDDMQIIVHMMYVSWCCLLGAENKGYIIYWEKKGGLNYFDFWGYGEKPTVFAPPSVFQHSESEALSDPSRFLTPSHRVAVNKEDLSIITYRVDRDGSDSLMYLIEKERSLALGRDETAKLLGKLLLRDLPAAEQLFGRDPDSLSPPASHDQALD